VICNSGVRNRELLDQLQPNVLCFGDPVFHFGPSSYAIAFRSDFANAMERLPELRAVVPDHFRGLLLDHYPQLEDRVMGLTLARRPAKAPDRVQGAPTRRTGNVLTQQMLPVALQFRPRRLSLVGCDGRRKEERYFWKHSPTLQYSDDLMRTVFEAHPSFFRDVSYADYYGRHCKELARWVELAENMGAIVDTLTPSFIPILEDRLRQP
jgi:hypothetical protein